jgi:2-polyprenyl-6-hydroxyphenyl methylase/3-demethylubiquinone-9 3-methyltransferase
MNTEKKTNVDESEIQKFDNIAKEWWDPNGPMKPLHQLNPLRLDFILQHQPLQDKKIIDIGCGGGILTEALAKKGADAIGLDLSPMALAAAREHAALEKLLRSNALRHI